MKNLRRYFRKLKTLQEDEVDVSEIRAAIFDDKLDSKLILSEPHSVYHGNALDTTMYRMGAITKGLTGPETHIV